MLNIALIYTNGGVSDWPQGKKRKHEQNEVQSIGNLRRLPTDVVEKLPEEIPLKLPKFDVEETSKEKPKSKKSENVKKRQDFRHRTDVDYIPLSSQSSTEFGVMPLEILARASKSMAARERLNSDRKCCMVLTSREDPQMLQLYTNRSWRLQEETDLWDKWKQCAQEFLYRIDYIFQN